MSEYLSLDAVFAELKKQGSLDGSNNLLYYLARQGGKNSVIEDSFKQLLAAEGFRKLRFLPVIGTNHDRGGSSIILESTDGQLARLLFQGPDVKHSDPKDFEHPAVLNPVKVISGPSVTIKIHGYKHIIYLQPRLDVMPFVPLPATQQEATEVFGSLIASGLHASDACALDNVKVFEFNGKRVPLLIDRDLLEKRNPNSAPNMLRWRYYNKLRTRHCNLPPIEIDDFSHDLWIDKETGTWKQKLWDPRILTNQPSGVFPEKELVEYAARNPNSSVVAAIREGELYVGELHNLLAEDGASKYDPKNPTKFEARLKNAASHLKGKSPGK